ncbi:MAG: SGNH/GDSL hydrolase family protein [Myxococcota bacterium]|nr:SGNH/GDSL hydrolase family protein [Myxococcota bacterium]
MRRVKQLALLTGTLVGVAVAAEIVLRLAVPGLALPVFRPGGYLDSQLHHRNPPNARMHDRFGLERYVVETNEDGLRSGWSRAAFRRQGVRIAVLGDSFAFGYGLPVEATLGVRLEQRLRDELGRDDVGVLNAGIVTYSPLLSGALFDDVVRHYAPTSTLLLLDVTDVADDHMYGGQRVRGGRRSHERRFAIEDQPFPDSPLRGLALWNLARPIRQLVAQWRPPPLPRGLRPARILIDGEEQRDQFFVMRYPLAKTRPFFQALLDNIDALAAAVRDAGSDFALVIGPRHVHWDASEAPGSPETRKYGSDATWHAEYIRFFEQVAPQLDYPVVELLPAFQDSPRRPLVFDHDPHWNADGHALVADELAAFLRERASPP